MSFSTQWETTYQSGAHLSIWPWSDLVSYVMRYARPPAAAPETYRVLELGMGAGANVPFFRHLGVDFTGIDGSASIVAQLCERYPDWRDRFLVGDFTESLPADPKFDLIVDRGAVTCNTTEATRRCLAAVHAALKPGGRFIGIDWFSTRYTEFGRGEPAEDAFTRTGYTDGPFAGLGRVHFADRPHLEDLFAAFELTILEHKLNERQIPDDGWQFAAWNLVAVKAAPDSAS